jgi:renalase
VSGWPVGIVGTGMAGVAAARTLSKAGVNVKLFEKSPRLGGRMATREHVLPDGRRYLFDHGCQHLSARGPDFAKLLALLLQNGILQLWRDSLPGLTGPGPYYFAPRGMRSAMEYLARKLDVLHESVSRIEYAEAGQYRIWTEDAEGAEVPYLVQSVVLTPPVPQCLKLLDAGGITVPVRDRLSAVTYCKRLTYLAAVEATALPGEAGVYPPRGPVVWVADNYAKGLSLNGPALTVHADPNFTDLSWDVDAEAIRPFLFPPSAPWSGGNELYGVLHRWRYAEAVRQSPEPFAEIAPGLLLAGDGFGQAKGAEAAFDSGRAAAKRLLNPS